MHADSSWKPISGLKHEFQVSNLDVGTYTIQTAIINPYDFSFVPSSSISISLTTPFWEQLSTRIGVSLFLLFITGFLVQRLVNISYKKRLKTLEKEQAQFKEREHLSRDLHDSIGTQLSLIIRHLTAASKEKDTLKRVLSAKDLAQFSLEQLRETIWALKSEEIHLDEYVNRIENLCNRLLNQTGIGLELKLDLQTNPKVSPIQLIQSQRILEESISNAIKYSETKKITVSLLSNASEWKLSIQDFGVGFDMIPKKGRPHYGLKHMQERAKEIQADLQIYSKTDAGTTIQLRVPISQ
jgi:signal transduction histidine kinase